MIKINKRSSSNIILILILIFFIFAFLPLSKSYNKNILITIQYLFIGCYAVVSIINETRKYYFSINLIHWLFIFLFMFCAGICQYATNSFRWDFEPTDYEVSRANWIVIIWCIFYSICYYFYQPKIKSNLNRSFEKNTKIGLNHYFASLFVFVLVVLSIYTIITVPLKSFFIREVYTAQSITSKISSSALHTLATALIRGLSLWTTMIYLSVFKYNKSFANFIKFLIPFICCLILVPPLGVARYVFASIYGAMLIFYFDIFKKKNIFIFGFLIGILFIFPMLNAFRGLYTTEVTVSFIKECIGNITSNFSKSDYDSYTMLVYTIRYCDVYSISFGKQLLSSLLFFIPRSIWQAKTGGSGSLIISLFNPSIPSNVSCPLIGEGYINFGVFGVLLFCLIISMLIKKIDKYYWRYLKDNSFWGNMIYSFLTFYMIFFFRGDLMSTLSYLIGFVVTFVIIFLFCRNKKRVEKNA